MTQAEVKKAISRYGKYVRKEGRKNIYKVVCQGCGKTIFNVTPVEIEAVITKSGTAIFWHSECTEKAWDSKLRHKFMEED